MSDIESGRLGTMGRVAAQPAKPTPSAAISREEAATGTPGSVANGPGAAAILAAGIGSLALGILAFAGDASPTILKAMNFWTPTGPLSGVTTLTIVVWLVSWYVLFRMWATRNLRLRPVLVTAFIGLAGGLLLTFPPFMDLLQGK